MPEEPRPDIVLVAESDYFLPEGVAADAQDDTDIYGPMNDYFLGPLDQLRLPHPYSLPNPPALGVVLLATYLRHRGFQALTFSNVFRIPAAREAFLTALDRKPLAVGISTTSLYTAQSLARIAGWVKERSPQTRIILGGYYAEMMEPLRACGDVTVLGEGEATLRDLLTAIKSGASWEDIPNLAWQEQGRWRATPRRANLPITDIPLPEWELLGLSPKFCHPVEASRGCRYECAFCSVPSKGNQRMRPIADVVTELRRNRERYGCSLFNFVDSNLTSYPEHTLDLCRAISAADLGIRWRCYSRADDFVRLPALAPAMREAGCRLLYLGLESGSDDILQRMHKGFTRAQLQEGVRIIRDAEILIHSNFLIGFPGETAATVAETLETIRGYGGDTVSFTVLNLNHKLREDCRRRADRHLGLKGRGGRWTHGSMDSAQARRWTIDCIDAVSLTMERPRVSFQRLLFYYTLASGMSEAESWELLDAFRDHRKAARGQDAALSAASLERIRRLYSRMLEGYPQPAVAHA